MKEKLIRVHSRSWVANKSDPTEVAMTSINVGHWPEVLMVDMTASGVCKHIMTTVHFRWPWECANKVRRYSFCDSRFFDWLYSTIERAQERKEERRARREYEVLGGNHHGWR